jgi:hypothetical protein
MFRFRRVGTSIVAGAFFLTNIVATHAVEKSLWEVRRAALDRAPRIARLIPPASAPLTWAPIPFDGGSTPSQPPSTLKHLAVPFDVASAVLPYGAIGEVHEGRRGAPVVFLVQDVHGNDGAQSNIGGLLTALGSRGTTLIGLEGAWVPLPLESYRRHPAPAVVHRVATALRRSDRLSGGEWAGMVSTHPLTLSGIESVPLYKANVAAAKDCVARRPAATDFLASLRSVLREQKKSVYSPELKSFDTHWQSYEDGREGLSVYAGYLAGLPLGEATAGPQVKKFLRAVEVETRLNFTRVESDRQSLMTLLTDTLSARDLENLLGRAVAYRAGQITNGDFYAYLRSLCDRRGLSLDQFPHFREYLDYVGVVEEINRKELLNELVLWETAMGTRLAKTDAQKKLFDLDRDAQLLTHLLKNEMTPDQWAAYRARREAILSIPSRLGLGNSTSFPNLSTLVGPHEDFCRLAMERNGALVENFAAQVQAKNASSAVLVAGGFHTHGVQAELHKRGYSTVVITPRIEKVGGNPLDVFARDPLPFDELFAGKPISLSPELMLGSDREAIVRMAVAAEGLRDISLSVPIDLWAKNQEIQVRESRVWRNGAREYQMLINGKEILVAVSSQGKAFENSGRTRWLCDPIQTVDGEAIYFYVRIEQFRRLKNGLKSIIPIFQKAMHSFIERTKELNVNLKFPSVLRANWEFQVRSFSEGHVVTRIISLFFLPLSWAGKLWVVPPGHAALPNTHFKVSRSRVSIVVSVRDRSGTEVASAVVGGQRGAIVLNNISVSPGGSYATPLLAGAVKEFLLLKGQGRVLLRGVKDPETKRAAVKLFGDSLVLARKGFARSLRNGVWTDAIDPKSDLGKQLLADPSNELDLAGSLTEAARQLIWPGEKLPDLVTADSRPSEPEVVLEHVTDDKRINEAISLGIRENNLYDVKIGNQVVGTVIFSETPTTVWVRDIFINSEFRRRGYGGLVYSAIAGRGALLVNPERNSKGDPAPFVGMNIESPATFRLRMESYKPGTAEIVPAGTWASDDYFSEPENWTKPIKEGSPEFDDLVGVSNIDVDGPNKGKYRVHFNMRRETAPAIVEKAERRFLQEQASTPLVAPREGIKPSHGFLGVAGAIDPLTGFLVWTVFVVAMFYKDLIMPWLKNLLPWSLWQTLDHLLPDYSDLRPQIRRAAAVSLPVIIKTIETLFGMGRLHVSPVVHMIDDEFSSPPTGSWAQQRGGTIRMIESPSRELRIVDAGDIVGTLQVTPVDDGFYVWNIDIPRGNKNYAREALLLIAQRALSEHPQGARLIVEVTSQALLSTAKSVLEGGGEVMSQIPNEAPPVHPESPAGRNAFSSRKSLEDFSFSPRGANTIPVSNQNPHYVVGRPTAGAVPMVRIEKDFPSSNAKTPLVDDQKFSPKYFRDLLRGFEAEEAQAGRFAKIFILGGAWDPQHEPIPRYIDLIFECPSEDVQILLQKFEGFFQRHGESYGITAVNNVGPKSGTRDFHFELAFPRNGRVSLVGTAGPMPFWQQLKSYVLAIPDQHNGEKARRYLIGDYFFGDGQAPPLAQVIDILAPSNGQEKAAMLIEIGNLLKTLRPLELEQPDTESRQRRVELLLKANGWMGGAQTPRDPQEIFFDTLHGFRLAGRVGTDEVSALLEDTIASFSRKSNSNAHVSTVQKGINWVFQGLLSDTDYVFSLIVNDQNVVMVSANAVSGGSFPVLYDVIENVDENRRQDRAQYFRFVPDRKTSAGQKRPRSQRGVSSKNNLASFLAFALPLSPETPLDQFNAKFTANSDAWGGQRVFAFDTTGKVELTVFEKKVLRFDGGLRNINEGKVSVGWNWAPGLGLIVYISLDSGTTYAFSIEQFRQRIFSDGEGVPNADLIGIYPDRTQAESHAEKTLRLSRLVAELYKVNPLRASEEEVSEALAQVTSLAGMGPIGIAQKDAVIITLIDPKSGFRFSMDMGIAGEGAVTPHWDSTIGLVLQVERDGKNVYFDFAHIRENAAETTASFSLVRRPNQANTEIASARNRAAHQWMAKALEEIFLLPEYFPINTPEHLASFLSNFESRKAVYRLERATKIQLRIFAGSEKGEPTNIIFLGLPASVDLNVYAEWVSARGPVFYFEDVAGGRAYAFGLGEGRRKKNQRGINATPVIPSSVVVQDLEEARRWVRNNPAGLIAEVVASTGGEKSGDSAEASIVVNAMSSLGPKNFPPAKQGRPYEFFDPLSGVRYAFPGVTSSWRAIQATFLPSRSHHPTQIKLTLLSERGTTKNMVFELPTQGPHGQPTVILQEVQTPHNNFMLMSFVVPFDPVTGFILGITLLGIMFYKNSIIRWLDERVPRWVTSSLNSVFPDLSHLLPKTEGVVKIFFGSALQEGVSILENLFGLIHLRFNNTFHVVPFNASNGSFRAERSISGADHNEGNSDFVRRLGSKDIVQVYNAIATKYGLQGTAADVGSSSFDSPAHGLLKGGMGKIYLVDHLHREKTTLSPGIESIPGDATRLSSVLGIRSMDVITFHRSLHHIVADKETRDSQFGQEWTLAHPGENPDIDFHVDALSRVLREAHRSLKPRGRIVLYFSPETFRLPGEPAFFGWSLHDMLSETGFSEIDIWKVESGVIVASGIRKEEGSRGLIPEILVAQRSALDSLTPEERNVFAQALNDLSPQLRDMPGVDVSVGTNHPVTGKNQGGAQAYEGERTSPDWRGILNLLMDNPQRLRQSVDAAVEIIDPRAAGAALAVLDDVHSNADGSDQTTIAAVISALLQGGGGQSLDRVHAFAESYNRVRSELMAVRWVGGQLSGKAALFDLTVLFKDSPSPEMKQRQSETWLAVAGALSALQSEQAVNSRFAFIVRDESINRRQVESMFRNVLTDSKLGSILSGENLILASEQGGSAYISEGKFSLNAWREAKNSWRGPVQLIGFDLASLRETQEQLDEMNAQLVPVSALLSEDLKRIFHKLMFIQISA